MDYASIIKERVPTPELFAFYGFERDRRGLVRCMFHQDNRASMKVYDDDGGYHCFSCNAHGDVINFVQQQFGLSFKDALSKINEDFRLRLPLNGSVDDELKRRIQREAETRQARQMAARKERERLYKDYDNALSEWIRLDRQRTEYAPTGPSETFDERYAEALRKIDSAAYILDCAEMAIYEFEHRK